MQALDLIQQKQLAAENVRDALVGEQELGKVKSKQRDNRMEM